MVACCDFVYDARLGIELPRLHREWEQIAERERESILARWETIRGRIPERVLELERIIMTKQYQLYEEESFPRSCELNTEIAELASAINDLHLWYRANQEMGAARAHQ